MDYILRVIIMEYASAEIMTVTAARELRDREVVFVGVGLPNLAVNLAKRSKPNIVMIYESGVIGANPTRLPLSIGGPSIVTRAAGICSMFEVFSFYLQGGRIDVGFLGGAQIDKYGNINSTVIGDYEKPKARLPGSGGACEMASLAKRILIISSHEKRNFPEKVDFITSPGFLRGKREREQLELAGRGPDTVITNLGTLKFHEKTGEMILTSIYPRVEIEEVMENTGWDLKISENLKVTEAPLEEELSILRQLDPERMYLGKAKV